MSSAVATSPTVYLDDGVEEMLWQEENVIKRNVPFDKYEMQFFLKQAELCYNERRF